MKIELVSKFCVGLIIAMLAFVGYSYNTLPESIPIHFNAKGEVDGYGSKKMIWMIPAIAMITFLLIRWTIKFSETAHIDTLRKWSTAYRGKSNDYIKRSVAYSKVQVTYLSLIITSLFCYICISIVFAANGNKLPFDALIYWLAIALIFIPVFNLIKFQLTEKDDL